VTRRALDLPGHAFTFGVATEVGEVSLAGCVKEVGVHRSLSSVVYVCVCVWVVIRHLMIHL
jgi:hypothetical protein